MNTTAQKHRRSGTLATRRPAQSSRPEALRCGVYVRISKDATGQAAGVERQEKECRALAAALGWTVVEVYKDNDISAYSGKKRPAYLAMLAAIKDGTVDAIVAWHADRLYRRLPDLAELIEVVQATKTVIRTVQSGALDLNTASGVMNAEILASVSKHEVAHSTERVLAAKSAAAAAGKYRGGPRAFGYNKRGMTIRKDEQKLVADAMTAVLAGESLASICRSWAAKGVRTASRRHRDEDGKPGKPQSHAWTPGELRRMLLRARNAGLIEHDAEDGRGSQVIGPAKWPPLVPEATWRAVKLILQNPARRTSTGSARVWLGSGLYRCGTCGAPVLSSTAGAGGRSGTSKPAYRCREGGAAHLVRDCRNLDDYVARVAIERLSRPDASDLLLPRPKKGPSAAALAAQAETLRTKLAGLADSYVADEITHQQMVNGTATARAKLAKVEAQMAASTGGSPLAGLPLGTVDVGKRWQTLPLDQRRAVLDTLMTVRVRRAKRGRPAGYVPGSGKAYFDPDSVEVEWKSDD